MACGLWAVWSLGFRVSGLKVSRPGSIEELKGHSGLRGLQG